MKETTEFDYAEFQTRFKTILQALGEEVVKDYAFFNIPSDKAPWFDTGLDLVTGDQLTSFAAGGTALKGTDLWLDPYFQLWFRIGEDGEIFRGTRDSHSFNAEQSGRLYLASYFPGEWSTKTGELRTPNNVYENATGSLSVLLIRWKINPLDGLNMLHQQETSDNLIAMEIDRLNSAVRMPEGWEYLWFMGPAEIYQDCKTAEDKPAICCHTHKDGGILQKSVVMPLNPNTKLSWAWKIDTLPSLVREDTLPTHDYLSIAVEFDNGQDITYYWSSALPVDTSYRCPIPTWNARETHVVVRSGLQGLGEWFNEERDVYSDYATAIGGPMPANIVKVWFIAVSLFQRKEGKCQYADIAFLTEDKKLVLL